MLIKRVWIDSESPAEIDAPLTSADVLVEMEDGQLWQARFVTLDHLRQEMELSLDVAREHTRALAPCRFLALETPHVVIEDLNPEAIEDVADNLMALGVFETVFAVFGAETDAGTLPGTPHPAAMA